MPKSMIIKQTGLSSLSQDSEINITSLNIDTMRPDQAHQDQAVTHFLDYNRKYHQNQYEY